MKYNKYSDGFNPKPTCFKNCALAFLVGGAICEIGYLIKSAAMALGADEETAGVWSTVFLICGAQLITGFGWYNTLGRIGGAGAAVPITGFANSVAAPAIEYKKEGQVMGIGCKIFTIAGPVILYGIFTSALLGLIWWIAGETGVIR